MANELNLFELATRQNYTFPTDKGDLNVYQLWQLPLTSKVGPSLDKIAQKLDQEIQAKGTRSFVKSARTTESTLLKNKLDIVLRVIEVVETENEDKTRRAANQSQAQRLREILARKEDQALENLTPEQIQAELAKLEANA